MQKENRNNIRVMIVDDSAFMRKVISDMLNETPGIEVIKVARDGNKALEFILQDQPDVITLDIEMPHLNGLETLERMKHLDKPPAVIMLSSYTSEGSKETIKALELGAVDFINKPSGSISLDIGKKRQELIDKIKTAYHARTETVTGQRPVDYTNNYKKSREKATGSHTTGAQQIDKAKKKGKDFVLALGASTGGPRALQAIIPQLPEAFPGCILIVQHMPSGFTKYMAERLDTISPMKVVEAVDGEPLQKGSVYIAPGNHHLRVALKNETVSGNHLKDWQIEINDDPAVKGLRPNADVMIESVAEMKQFNLMAVILTGMGDDGSKGIKRLKRSGGTVIAEDESTCVVFGMPRAAINTGMVDEVKPLPQIAKTILSRVT